MPKQIAKSNLFCSFHLFTTHNTVDYRAGNDASSGQVPTSNFAPNNRTCNSCFVVGWTQQHPYNTALGGPNTDNNLHLGVMTIGNAPGHSNHYANDDFTAVEHAVYHDASTLWVQYASTSSAAAQKEYDPNNHQDTEMTDFVI